MTDIDIARSIEMLPIIKVLEKYGVCEDDVELYGKYKAKLSSELYDKIKNKEDARLILVTAINPTPAGEGKTTVSIGLAQALNKIGKKAVLALREPSLGPCFGMKGGAAGGGYSQLIPMEDLNLHFTGDFHAITTANNLLCAMLDNHIQQGNALNIDTRQIQIKRCLDINDRVLRNVVVGLGSKADGYVREDHFTITVASEIMAILCLSNDLKDLEAKLENILVAYDVNSNPIYAKDIKAVGAMTVLLKDAIKPNVIQSIEHGMAIVHGGPFANIAHGCNSIIATKYAQKIGDYVITEAGFGADLGAEKFFDIKSRYAKLAIADVVIVATVKALKYNGYVDKTELDIENIAAIKKGIVNLEKHIENIRKFGYNPIVAINRFPSDTDEEINTIKDLVDVETFEVNVHSKGGKGAIELAKFIVDKNSYNKEPNYVYNITDSIKDKIYKVATEIYGADDIEILSSAMTQIKKIEKNGYGDLPICIAKTQYSFSDNPKKLGRPKNFNITIRNVYVNSGAGMIIVLTGDIMTMPGLPKKPAAVDMYIDENGYINGLS